MIASLIKILPNQIFKALQQNMDTKKLYELRLRANKPVLINYGGEFFYLSPTGRIKNPEKAFVVSKDIINDIIIKAGNYSLYAVNNQICDGYITLVGGVRIGICGEIVWDENKIKTIKNFSSINIRVPHEVLGCAVKAYEFCFDRQVHNTLIISPPGAGKTTLLRDLARLLGNKMPILSILVADERNEIASCINGIAQLDVGLHTDVISNCSKEFAFTQAVRGLRPDIILADEIYTQKDINAIEYVASCGVTVVATVHAYDYLELVNKPGFDTLIKKRIFTRFVNLSAVHGPGTYDGIYDENFNCIYCP